MKTALLIIDMQEFFLGMIEDKIGNIIKLSEHFSATSAPQIFTQHGHPPEDFEEPITNQLIRKWGESGSLHRGSDLWQLVPEVKKLVKSEGDVVHKNVYDAFLFTDLEDRLRKLKVERVVICGVMTDCCCDTTGRGAFNRGFETWMVSDASGSVNKAQHEAGLKAWSYGYGEVLKTSEVIKKLF
ncbi:Isochorismatase-like protein [Lophiotrema nucula]|uniref:Isochorismatase-like protein n=1 Tax=Lophiotrema nucula TaxID=690887 RepID=A0A6A5ZFC2_9PLEO|nr:Isochorismatase-like protein [Lophiotrema nucula]